MTPRRPRPVPPADFWHRPEVAEALANRDIGAFLKIYQRWSGATQTQIATACEVPQSHISHIIRGKRQVTSLDMYERFASGLDIPRALLGLAEPAAVHEPPAAAEHTGPDRRIVLAATAATVVLAADEELDEVTQRMQLFAATNVNESAVQQLDMSVDLIGRRYESSDAATAYPTALRQRRYVAELMSGHQHPRYRGDLYVVAGKLSGLLGYLAFDLGNELLARAYCNEAMSLAQAAGNRDLAAWVRGTQSFVAFYAGRYKQALDYARDGQRYAAGGPASIRLAISGEARTLGKLGDRRGVDDAVSRALAAHARADHVDPVGYFLSFEPFGAARLAGNAASAYLALGAVDRVREFTDEAIPIFARSNSAASHALTLVDASLTYLTDRNAEPDRAGVLVSEALTVGAKLRSQIVASRAKDFVTSAAPWAHVPEIAEVAEAVAAWRVPSA
ncbi:helix-turn-helix domain-containing protein [Frankia sp. AgB1.9]|uniref:helix-turn-helix domain-containing protein n=1 Tax=unclassified Frankia TaxID=2632575 RepID=UPI00193143C9|nr:MULTISPECIES: helix-turn-helix domain-containing protein [unclassified Frankia]MBL7487622.1 helix-turn-helix domain-containing protein [Frankia sp. AgW1.1]MBL7548912.1 helix-turn-helix domain-containing protein [Frankia sp. AgB1.9]MBL7624880.1 helix-turn-helix domain-containing protein [Frankia sp. AgB1.8]